MYVSCVCSLPGDTFVFMLLCSCVYVLRLFRVVFMDPSCFIVRFIVREMFRCGVGRRGSNVLMVTCM